MILVVRIMGAVMLSLGLAFLIKPAIMKNFISSMKKAGRIYAIGALRMVFGVIFVLSASAARHGAVITAVGILMLIGSIMIFALGVKRVAAIMEWYLKIPDPRARILASVPVFLGILIIYSA